MDRENTDIPPRVEPEERTAYIDTGSVIEENRLVHYDAMQEGQGIPKQPITNQMLREDVNNPESWLLFNKGLEETGFSPANRVTAGNIDSLERTYTVQVKSSGMQTDPIVIPTDPPVMYFTEMNQRVHAINARTGERFWTFQPALNTDIITERDPLRNRGVAPWQDKVYLGTNLADIFALDRYTGEPLWNTNTITETQKKRMAIEPQRRHGISAAPMTFNGKVYWGHSSDEGGFAAMGALDAETGEMLWNQNAIAFDGWVTESWRFGAGGAWMNATIDPETNTVFWVTGNPNPQLSGLPRPGPNKDTNSVMAFDANNGEIKWITQSIPHEVWDYDFTHVATVTDLEVEDGQTKRAVIVEDKTGWLWTLDIEDGQVIERSKPFARQDHSEFGRSFLSMPPRGQENMKAMWPSTDGATEFPADAYSPETGLYYIGANDLVMLLAYDPSWTYSETEVQGTEVAGSTGIPDNLGKLQQQISVVAVDPVSGDIAWENKLEFADTSVGADLLWTGGTTATAGNVVFHGSADGHLYAFNAKSGKRLWVDDTGGRITASPVVWEDPAEEAQFVSVAADDRVVTYKSTA